MVHNIHNGEIYVEPLPIICVVVVVLGVIKILYHNVSIWNRSCFLMRYFVICLHGIYLDCRRIKLSHIPFCCFFRIILYFHRESIKFHSRSPPKLFSGKSGCYYESEFIHKFKYELSLQRLSHFMRTTTENAIVIWNSRLKPTPPHTHLER